MPAQKRGLGKGLGALIPTGPPPENASGSGGTATATATAPPPPAAGRADYPPPPEQAAPQRADELGRLDAYFDELPTGSLTPNPRQPRQVFDEDALAELADSIEAVGLLQPVVVRRTLAGQSELIMGERRWR